MDRKDFMKACGLACISGTALVTILQSCASSTYFAQHTLTKNQIIIKKSEFVLPGKGESEQRKYILIATAVYNFPICVYKLKIE
jgi:cytochrome b6-f complex iron-sulfur subunit